MRTDDKATYERMQYYSRKAKAIAYLGGECVVCGGIEELEFDHIDPSTKSFPITRKLVSNWEDIVVPELDKCQLLCKKHHLEKSISEKPDWAHGNARGWQKYKCPCDKCQTRKKADVLRYNKVRRAKAAANPKPLATHCKNGHEFTEENTLQLPQKRCCITCLKSWPLNTHCKKGHPLTDDNVYVAPGGDRFCKICKADNTRRQTERRRAKRKAEKEK